MAGLSGCSPNGEGLATVTPCRARCSNARDRNEGPAIWVAKDFDSTLYLFGTVHLLPDDLDWQREDMREAFSEAGTVFFRGRYEA